MVQTLVLAAGNSFPIFRAAGSEVPKVLKQVNGKSVLSRALESYVYDPGAVTVVLSKQENELFNISETVQKQFPESHIVEVPDEARGALISALFGIGNLVQNEPLLIVSGDSEISGGIYEIVSGWVAEDVSGGTVVVPATDPRFSYVKKDSEGNVAQVVEKQVVSVEATTGVFYFASVESFKAAATWCLVNNASLNGQFFNSTAVNYLIEQGSQIAVSVISPNLYKVWSRPSDFEGK